MLAISNNPSLHEQKMHLAGHLMYEMALRRQDAVLLTYEHFMNTDNLNDDSYYIEFKCVKQNEDRNIEISSAARDAVLKYRSTLEERGTKVKDSDELFKYGNADQFARVLKRFVAKNGFPTFQSHDFRVSRACEMYVQTGDLEMLRRFFKHSD